ncbi:MAG TPA: ABC transporter ATP-binding protein [Gammaproteobacteria bacterium]|nr:ABC transporter ATP-binding protein [Gammaproteobacteria bacterium]
MNGSSSGSTEAAAAVRVLGVSRHYGAVRAVDGVDLAIARGELFGLIGHNGAGKSTLFKMMLGLVRPTRGSVQVDGIDVGGSAFRAVRRRIGYLPENVVFYDNLSGYETLRFFARLKAAPETECVGLLRRVGLGGAARRRLREYSKGMRQRLGLAQALLGDPQLLFLDEPTTGLDPEGVRDFYAILNELKADGATIVLTSHVLAEIQQRVDRLAIMAAGRVRAVGSVPALRAERDLPVRITVEVAPGMLAGVRTALAVLPLELGETGGTTLEIAAPRALKLDVLSSLARAGSAIRDVEVREASLEDLFFGEGNP